MRMITALLLSTFLITSLFASQENDSTQEVDLFTSKDDGKFDVSEYLETKYGFLPVPIVITEPAVGYGGGASLLFLHDTLGSSLVRKSPPDMSGIAAFATENGTWVGAAFHLGYWLDDTIRSTTSAGAFSINMNFYPVGNIGVDLNFKGYFAYQELMFRISDSNFFLGGNYVYSDNTIKLNDEQSSSPLVDKIIKPVQMGALSGIVQYDSRNTTFTPSQGLFAKLNLRRFDDTFGGNENFWRYGAKAFYFIPAHKRLVIGLRAEGEAVDANNNDRIPIYSYPAIVMRGIPAMRYQGEKMLLAELQLRWEFINRWNLVAFGGGGKVFGTKETEILNKVVNHSVSFSDADFHPAGGLGFRYELARKFGLWGGMDFATSEENNFAFYFTVGSAWGAF